MSNSNKQNMNLTDPTEDQNLSVTNSPTVASFSPSADNISSAKEVVSKPSKKQLTLTNFINKPCCNPKTSLVLPILLH